MSSARDSLDVTDRAASRRLGQGFLALAAVTYVLIVLGALVRAHGAGLACPDWPLCFGEVIPAFDFKVAFEWGHRALAGTVGLVFAALGAFVVYRPQLRRHMLTGLLIAALLLAAQVILGGLTVLELLASWTVTSHLVTGNAFALALVLLSRRLLRFADEGGAGAADASDCGVPLTTRLWTSIAAATLAVQIVLGGLVSSNYAGLACPDWPTCMNGEFFPAWTGIQGLHVLHRTTAYALAGLIPLAAWLGRDDAGPRRWLAVAAGLVLAQVLVGIANVVLRIPVEVTGLHSALAAGLICTMGVATREVWRGPLRA